MKNKIIFASIIGIMTFVLFSFKPIEMKDQFEKISDKETNFYSNNQTIIQSKISLSCTKCHDCKKDEVLDYENQKSVAKAIDFIEDLSQKNTKNIAIIVNSINEESINDENPDNFKFLK